MKLVGGYEKESNGIEINFQLENMLNNSVSLTFPSGQQYEIYIVNDGGEEVYRYSEDRFFTMAMMMKQLEPGERLSWKEVWNYTNKAGQKLTNGQYKVYVELKAMADDPGIVSRSNLQLTLELNI
ncbi:BsuPI-related putative proteinase inhibitor [Alkaliphilus transvaalensis]|uniref:BsuPI-related putative proteinase inhibitor n=1 Tax=Alkaliphilus transvaalensis TaxID=114628 RepID=UPI000687492F|nr:BsuPI-related putative proteinase inhibitor [Alkaliphilus transvaalensis]